MGGHSGILAAVALALAQPAPAQPPATPTPDPAACEFHVWPGDALMSVYFGWFHGSIVNGQIRGRPGYPRVPPDPIDTATQRAILETAQPQRLMAQPAHQLIVHPEALTSRAIRTTPGRLTDSASSCYAELVVDDVILAQGMAGSSLNTLFRYRDFGPDARPRRSFATFARTELASFPPNRPDQLDAAIAEIREAYRANLRQFASAARRPPRPGH